MLHVFIINSFAGNGDFADSVREKLGSENEIEYLVFNSEYPGDEGVLAREIYELFENEQIRFYACGGSGTFRNIINALPDYERAEFAEIPYGLSNDFINEFGKVWDSFRNIDSMINGNVISVDYIKSNVGVAVNSLSTGFDVQLIKTASHISDSIFSSGLLSYILGGIRALFKKCSFKAEIQADGRGISGIYDMIMVANGSRVGGSYYVTAESSPFDGRMELVLLPHRNFWMRLAGFIVLLRNNQKKIDKYFIRMKVSRIKVNITGADNVECNFDGEIENGKLLDAQIVPRGIKYVVPAGLEVHYE